MHNLVRKLRQSHAFSAIVATAALFMLYVSGTTPIETRPTLGVPQITLITMTTDSFTPTGLKHYEFPVGVGSVHNVDVDGDGHDASGNPIGGLTGQCNIMSEVGARAATRTPTSRFT